MIVAGFGFRQTATVASLQSALAATKAAPTALAAPHDKCAATILISLANSMNLPLIPVRVEDLSKAETLTRSARVMEERGTGSVAEAAALVAAGPGARLQAPRSVSQDRLATCAIAERKMP